MEYANWIVFFAAIIIPLGIDFFVFQKKKTLTLRQAAVRSAFWISAAAVFGVYVYLSLGSGAALDFTTAYIIEKSLSIDNLFVFAVIFAYFGIKAERQRKVLFWGIIGALVMRGLFIFAGVEIINSFHPSIYAFGAFLLYSGYGLSKSGFEKVEPEKNIVVRFVRKLLPLSNAPNPKNFFVNRRATTLFIALITIEITDIIFAQDSVPSVLTITTNFYIVYASNIFAILGLRALFFLVIGLLEKLRYLHFGLAALMGYLGIKFLATDVVHIPTVYSLLIVSAILGVTIAASCMKGGKKRKRR